MADLATNCPGPTGTPRQQHRPGDSRARRWHSGFSGLLLSVAVIITGCIDNKDVARYRAVLDRQHPTTLPAYLPDDPLPLQRALQLANADNEAIGITGENYIQALADKMKAAGTFLPTLTVAPTYSLSHGGGSSGFLIGGNFTGSGTTSGGTTSGTTSSGSSTVQLTGSGSHYSHDFSVPLAAGVTGSLSNVSTLQASSQTVDQRRLLLLDERETILLQVVQSYYSTIKDERQVAVYEGTVKFKTEKVRDQEARLKLGAAKSLDVATSQSDLAATQVSLTQARADAANARSALARLMGVEEVRGPLVDQFDPPTVAGALQDWRLKALNNRQDLQAAQRGTLAARLKVQSAIEEYFPSVTINFNYFLYNDPASSQNWTGGVSGNIPIFSALSIEADVRSAWSQFRQAALTESQTRRLVVDDVNQQYENTQTSREKIKELEIEVTAAQKAFDLAERAYHLGSETNLDRLTQQDSLLTAQLNLVSEQFNLKSNYLDLLRVTGSLADVLR